MGKRKKNVQAAKIGAGKIAVLIGVAAACVASMCGCERVTPTDQAAKAHGMPLDACEVVEYDCPVWLKNCMSAYKVCDRTTGDAWWLLDMGVYDGTPVYIVLPIDGEEVAE